MNNNLNKPIKVLQLGSPTGLYGAERWILALIRNLNPKKVESVVGVIKDEPDLEAPLCKAAERLGFQTITLNAYGKASISAITQLRRYIIRNKIDILHTHWYKTDIIGYFATRGTRCKIISTPHGWSRDAGLKLQCYEMLDRLIFPFFTAVAPLSPNLYANLKCLPFLRQKLKYIQNGVDTIEIENCKTIDPQLIEWKKQGYFIIGYIGQLIHRKGLDILLKAASILKIKYKIVLIGEGEQQEYLKQLTEKMNIEGNTVFLGFKKNRLEYLKGFDVFVLPSRLEGIPRCLMEALSSGIPVISSNIPGSVELIEHEKTGFLFSAETHGELAEKLLWVKQNKKDATKIAHRGKEKIYKKYSAYIMAKKYTALFESII